MSCLVDAKRINEAVQVQSAIAGLTVAEEWQDEFNSNIWALEIIKNNIAGAQIAIDKIAIRKPNSIELYLAQSEVERLKGNVQLQQDLLTKAVEVVDNHSLFVDLYRLSSFLFKEKRFSDAAKVLELIADKDNQDPDDNLVRTLLESYYYSDQLEKALNLALHILKKHGAQKRVSQMAMSLCELIDDFVGASQIAKDYLSKFPDDFEMRLNLAVVNYHTKDENAVDEFLKYPFDVQKLQLKDAFDVASLFCYRKRYHEAVELAYEARRLYETEEEAHRRYIFFFLESLGLGSSEDWLYPDQVGIDTIVKVKSDEGNVNTYLIEERAVHRNPLSELSATNPLALLLMSSKVGQTVVLKSSPFGDDTGIVTEVKSKFINALHESMFAFGRSFPESKSFSLLKIPNPAARSDVIQRLSAIERSTLKAYENYTIIEELYRTTQLPIGAFAKLLNKHIIHVWQALTSYEHLKLFSSSYYLSDLDTAKEKFNTKPRLIADIISVLTLYMLPCKDKVVNFVGKLGITQNTYDEVLNLLMEWEHSSPSGQISAGPNGQPVIHEEITVEATQRNIQFVKNLLSWMDSNCEVLINSGILNEKPKRRDEIKELLGSGFYETIVLASQSGNLLYSDDQRVRALAKGEYSKDGVWTQALLIHLADQNVITQQDYEEAVVFLCDSNYNTTFISTNTIVESARLSGWSVKMPFTKVVQQLHSPFSHDAIAIKIVVEAVYQLSMQGLTKFQMTNLTLALITALRQGRELRSPEVFLVLKQQVKATFDLAPISRFAFLETIEASLKANPLLSQSSKYSVY